MYKYIFFDLDGTLTDPGIGITNSVMYALAKYGIAVKDRSELYPFIGPPLKDSFMRFFHFPESQAEEAISFYREYFREKGLFENEVYDGVVEMLETLKKNGKQLVLATSKPEEFSIRILKHFQLFPFFDFVGAATMDGSRSKKADVIAYAIAQMGISDRTSILMVGDRDQDVVGAKANQIASAGVLYGYGSREELSSVGADYIVSSPLALLELV